ncbi:MAG: transcriptional repressor [Clostridia bacterium]|nr:transcriptional repressor [Clostridia bacterium]
MENSYNTKQGELILNILKSGAGEHFTADDIIRLSEKDGKKVGKATVYRHLDKLIRAGEVRKYIVEEGMSACFEYVGASHSCHSHYHLKCSSCGELLHVRCDFLDEVSSHIFGHHGFEIKPEKTVLYGICQNCREAENV